jgi:CyaY protein
MLGLAMSETLSEKTFDQLADQTLSKLVDALGELDDLEADLSQGVLTVKFEDGKRYVINSHRAARQIWMAAESSAWHFDWDGSKWVSTKSKDELLALIAQTVGKKLGRKINLS